MGTVLSFMIPTVVILGCFSLAMYLKYKDRFVDTDGLTFAEMEECEYLILKRYEQYLESYRRGKENPKLSALDVESLARGLKLEIISDSSPMTENKRCVLSTSDSPECNGAIHVWRGETDQKSKNFDILHEIVHYLKDVGVGKKVSKSFARTHHSDGYRRGHREQIVDYYAAAMAIPEESLRDRIKTCSRDPYSEEFVNKMMEVYEMPRETVVRRINEVSFLS